MEPEQDTTGQQKRQPRLLCLLFDNQISMWKYILRTGLISLVPSLVIAMILGLTGVITEETGPEFKGPALGLFIGLIIIAPPLETLLMAGGLWILSFITKRPVRLAVISAILRAGMHSLIAPAWGLGGDLAVFRLLMLLFIMAPAFMVAGDISHIVRACVPEHPACYRGDCYFID